MFRNINLDVVDSIKDLNKKITNEMSKPNADIQYVQQLKQEAWLKGLYLTSGLFFTNNKRPY